MASCTRVECALTNCMYYTTRPNDSACYCTHSDKLHYITNKRCPLYRMDWTRAARAATVLRDRVMQAAGPQSKP